MRPLREGNMLKESNGPKVAKVKEKEKNMKSQRCNG